MKTLEGMTLEEIQEAIKETRDAYACEIYTIKHEQEHPLIGAIKIDDCWLPMSWDLNGRQYSINEATAFDLKLPADKIDWSAFPVDTLVFIPNVGKRYLNGTGGYYANGADSASHEGSLQYIAATVELIEGRIMPWFGGDRPVPDNIEVEMFNHEGVTVVQIRADGVTWGNQIYGAYRLTGRIL